MHITKHRFTIEFDSEAEFPTWKGSTFRGGFGHWLNRVACPAGKNESCPVGQACPYHYIFESRAEDSYFKIQEGQPVPKPFVVEAPNTGKREYGEGDQLSFDFVSIGRAADFFPYIYMAFKKLGKNGIGIGRNRGKGRYTIQRIESLDIDGESAETVFDQAEGDEIHNQHITLKWGDFVEQAEERDQVQIVFETPTELIQNEDLVFKPSFYQFFKKLLSRFTVLSHYHCDQNLDWNFKQILDTAREIETDNVNTESVKLKRYSSRQNQKMYAGGIIGEAVYSGPIDEQMNALLELGKHLHVGKKTVYGNGKYVLLD
jgi:hypothetical protein